MIKGEIPTNENERLAALLNLDILDTIEEQAYDDLTHLASQICDTPIALVSLVDANRQWFKSHHGLDARETPRDFAFCAHAINSDDLFIIEDADNDERFHDNPLTSNAPLVKFYAGAPLIFEDNIRVGTLCVIDNKSRNITAEQKTSLKALARQVVSQLKLRLQLKELQNLDHTKDEFLSMVNHELRTPLTSLIGSLGILEHHASTLDDEMKPMLEIARRNSDQLLLTVNDILDLSKMEAGKLELTCEKIDLKALLNQALTLNSSYIGQCHCHAEINTENPGEPIHVYGDEHRLLQVLSNLISNASKFSPDEGTIILNLTIDNDIACISITNTGHGIPVEQQKMIFKKFQQLGNEKNQKLPGTGLGLSICKHIIEAHNGTIGFESIPDEKTTFYFKLAVKNSI